MNGRDCRLDGIGAGVSRRECLFHQLRPLGDLCPPPATAVLFIEKDDLATGTGAGVAARIVEQHQREEPDRLRRGKELHDQTRQPNRLVRQVVTRQ